MDRIVSIGAFEAFRVERYPAFFAKAYSVLPDDGRMLLHHPGAQPGFFRDNGIKITISDLKFMKFIEQEIFPGGRLPAVEDIESWLPTRFHAGARPPAAAALRAHARHVGREPGEEQGRGAGHAGQEVYDRYMNYLTGCADFFHRGVTNVGQFTLVK